VGRCEYGVDLHTGAIHRPNLPQIRADLGNPDNLRLARAFGAYATAMQTGATLGDRLVPRHDGGVGVDLLRARLGVGEPVVVHQHHEAHSLLLCSGVTQTTKSDRNFDTILVEIRDPPRRLGDGTPRTEERP